MYQEEIHFEDDFLYCRRKRNAPSNMPFLHFHRHYEIYYLLSGERKYFIGSRIITMNEGDIALIPPHVAHKTNEVLKSTHERLLVNFNLNFMGLYFPGDIRNLFNRSHITIEPEYRNEFEKIFFKIEAEYLKNDKYSNTILKGLLFEMLVFLFRSVNIEQEQEKNPLEQIVETAAKYITQNFSENISLEKVAKQASLSTSYFSKSFREYVGLGFNKYLTYVRIMNAERLLADTNDSISEVSAKCGFDDSNYFASVFKEHKGMTPLKFRKQINKGILPNPAKLPL